jgi:hypothetical protein
MSETAATSRDESLDPPPANGWAPPEIEEDSETGR